MFLPLVPLPLKTSLGELAEAAMGGPLLCLDWWSRLWHPPYTPQQDPCMGRF